jgi:hypothetical protein
MLYAMHAMTRDFWFESKPKGALFQAFKNDAQSNKIMTIRGGSVAWWDQLDTGHPAAWGNLVPAVAAYFLLLMEYLGTPLR